MLVVCVARRQTFADFMSALFDLQVPYLCWAVLYYFKIFVWSSHKIQQRNYDTLFKVGGCMHGCSTPAALLVG